MFDTIREKGMIYMLFQKKKKVQIKIEGMHCDACKNRIMNVLNRNSHVMKCDISLEDKQATLLVDEKVDLEDLKKNIEALDFQVTEIKEK